MVKICVFGDSIAKGVVYDNARGKYTYLKDCFANIFSQSRNLPIKNFARFGCTITKGAEILEKHQKELSEYSYTVLEFGGNDCDLNWAEIAETPEKSHLPNVPLDHFEKCYEAILKQIKAAGSIPVMLSLPPLDAGKFFAWVSKGLSQENILKYLGDVDFIFRWHESYNKVVCKIAQANAIRFIDIRAAFLATGNYSDYLCDDGMHPNKKGHLLINQTIQKQLPSLI